MNYADDCLVFASNKDEKITKDSLESNINNLANYLGDHQLNMAENCIFCLWADN